MVDSDAEEYYSSSDDSCSSESELSESEISQEDLNDYQCFESDPCLCALNGLSINTLSINVLSKEDNLILDIIDQMEDGY